MNNFYLLDVAQNQAQPGAASMASPIIMLVILFAAMYFFMIRPQKKQEKQINEMRNNLMVGDEVTTNGGIMGRIVHVKDDVVTIETGSDRLKIKVRKWAIATVDKKIKETPNVPKGGYKVTSVKKGESKADNTQENKPELK